MSIETKTNHLIQVKQDLAEKYERLSRQTSSQAKRRQFAHRALKYRRQVDQLQHATNG